MSAFADRFELRCEPKQLMLLYYEICPCFPGYHCQKTKKIINIKEGLASTLFLFFLSSYILSALVPKVVGQSRVRDETRHVDSRFYHSTVPFLCIDNNFHSDQGQLKTEKTERILFRGS